ncbi:hypothetical protein JAAARDRAFT_589160 [Jaapia argillacea MUCL 33604]|uniref:Uncharacterized protein n=1 Tax=Jaapia argillacea MUCL 33604 TaxID=933084 RepID=A0A067P637_9AGAM|nr:hypothetical protein JAAARDRAFT_589160 [Jaapia argillacea MUCL 33604]
MTPGFVLLPSSNLTHPQNPNPRLVSYSNANPIFKHLNHTNLQLNHPNSSSTPPPTQAVGFGSEVIQLSNLQSSPPIF